jgi:threonine aldolase
MTVELRSDTFTMPTPAMREAMVTAPLGDDVYGEDPTVHALEDRAAAMLGMAAACLMPSGTMANLAALTAHAPRGSRVFAGRESDIYVYEAHGVSVCSGVALEPVEAPGGVPDLAALERAMPEDPDDPQFAPPAVLCLENSANRAGGVPLSRADLAGAVAFARTHGLAVHLDGARVFNAAVALGTTAAEVAADADSAQFCLSKGLCAPIGSMVTGSAEFITRVRRVRKMLGGGMRQAGVIAAAGLVALDTMVDRLAEDHANAARLATGLAAIPGVVVEPVPSRTNMVMFRTSHIPHADVIAGCARQDVRLAELGHGQLRAVTHHGVTAEDVDHAVEAVASVVAAPAGLAR